MTIEIERKWLLKALPRLSWSGVRTIFQGYLVHQGYQVRIRRTLADGRLFGCVLSRKTGKGMSRVEVEEPLSDEAFDLLWPLTEGRRLQKDRHLYEGVDGLVWEVDVYKDHLWGLVTAELELPSEDQQVSMPAEIEEVLVREVTGEAAYLNSNLARSKGLPPGGVPRTDKR